MLPSLVTCSPPPLVKCSPPWSHALLPPWSHASLPPRSHAPLLGHTLSSLVTCRPAPFPLTSLQNHTCNSPEGASAGIDASDATMGIDAHGLLPWTRCGSPPSGPAQLALRPPLFMSFSAALVGIRAGTSPRADQLPTPPCRGQLYCRDCVSKGQGMGRPLLMGSVSGLSMYPGSGGGTCA